MNPTIARTSDLDPCKYPPAAPLLPDAAPDELPDLAYDGPGHDSVVARETVLPLPGWQLPLPDWGGIVLAALSFSRPAVIVGIPIGMLELRGRTEVLLKLSPDGRRLLPKVRLSLDGRGRTAVLDADRLGLEYKSKRGWASDLRGVQEWPASFLTTQATRLRSTLQPKRQLFVRQNCQPGSVK